MAALAKLSPDELAAAFTLLAERAHQITMAQELIRDAQQGRRLSDDDKHAAFDEFGQRMLDEAVAGAPAKATEIRDAEQARLALIARLLVEVPASMTMTAVAGGDRQTIGGAIPENLMPEAAAALTELSDLSEANVRVALEPYVRYLRSS